MRLHALVAVLPFVFAGACGHRAHDNPDALRWQEALPPGSTLHVRDGVGDVVVRPSPSGTASVNGSTHWRRGSEKDIAFAVERRGQDVYICAMWRYSGGCRSGYRGRRDSPLAFLSLFHHPSDATAQFEVAVPAGVAVDASTMLGQVDVSGVAAGVVAKSVNGDVRVLASRGPMALSTVNGNVHLMLDSIAGLDSVSLHTVNGNILAELPAYLEGRVDVSTLNGSLQSDFPITTSGASSRHIAAQLGSSVRLLRFVTVNGGITLQRNGSRKGTSGS